MADKETGEDILRAILEKGSDKAKKDAAGVLSSLDSAPPEVKAKRTKRSLGDLVGKIGKSKYYENKDGDIVDEEGKPVSKKLEEAFGRRDDIRKAMPKSIISEKTTLSPNKLNQFEKELDKTIVGTTKLAESNNVLMKQIPVITAGMNNNIQTLVNQTDIIIQSMQKQNQDFQDRVIEQMTGVKAATRSAGAKARPTSARAVGGSRAAAATPIKAAKEKARISRSEEVKERSKQIATIRAKRNIAKVALAGAAGAAAGVGLVAAALAPSGTAPGGTIPGVAPGGMPSGLGPQGAPAGRPLARGGTFDSQAPGLMNRLQSDFGLTREQAAGIVGNLGHESAGLQAGIQEGGVTRGRGGLGWAQWTGPRRRAFEAYLERTGQSATDPESNYGFLKEELNTTHKRSLSELKKTSDVQSAMMVFEKHYEAAGVKHYEGRMRYARRAMELTGTADTQVAMGAPEATTATLPTGAGAPVPSGVGPQTAPTPTGAAIASPPPNVTLGANVDVSKVDPDLLQKFYQAAQEYGKPVSINSGYRGDDYQAELWVRANVFREPGIYSPAKPQSTTTISYRGKQYTVEGGGRGSAHGRGQAIDITPGPDMDPFLRKYGLHRPHASFDPPHVQKIGGEEYAAASQIPTGAPAATTPTLPTGAGGPRPTTVSPQPAPAPPPPAVSAPSRVPAPAPPRAAAGEPTTMPRDVVASREYAGSRSSQLPPVPVLTEGTPTSVARDVVAGREYTGNRSSQLPPTAPPIVGTQPKFGEYGPQQPIYGPPAPQQQALATLSQRNAVQESADQGSGQQVIIMNNERMINNTRTIYQQQSRAPSRGRPDDFNPLVLAGAVAGLSIAKALRIF